MLPSKSKTLFISPLPPSRCGIATYAFEHIQSLKSKDSAVTTWSMLNESHADLHSNLTSIASCFRAICKALCLGDYHLIVHFADNYFFPWRNGSTITRKINRILQSLWLHLLAKKSKDSLIVIHEILTVNNLNPVTDWSRSFAFGPFDKIAFHTTYMKNDFLKRFKYIPESKTMVIDHAFFMQRHFHGTRQEARVLLNLKPDKKIFLCCGFIHRSKGFHDAVEAFGLLTSESSPSELHIVGSVAADNNDAQSYAYELSIQCELTMNAFLHQIFLDDKTFDTWLAAADVLILPYLGVASSGVGARASLYDTDLIVRDLPNLVEQFPNAAVFSNQKELSRLIENYSV